MARPTLPDDETNELTFHRELDAHTRVTLGLCGLEFGGQHLPISVRLREVGVMLHVQFK